MERSGTHFEGQLDEIAEKVLRLAGMAEEAIGKSIRALIQHDSAMAQEIIDGDVLVDRLELEIDHLCLETLARQQPMAGDLRFLATAMKITPDLERIADHAVNISERVLELNEEPPLKASVDLPLMAARAQEMVRGALDAFVRRDSKTAWEVIAMDDDLDRRMESTFRVLLSHMIEDPRTISRALRLTFVAKYFERIGDMATNICEQVVFMCEARVVKHARTETDSEEPKRS